MTAEICRVCEGDFELKSIFAPENKHILKKLRACADITLDLDDELPKYLCSNCNGNLEFAYKFKIQCEYTEQKLKDALSLHKLSNFTCIDTSDSFIKGSPQSETLNSTDNFLLDEYENVELLIDEDDGESEPDLMLEQSHENVKEVFEFEEEEAITYEEYNSENENQISHEETEAVNTVKEEIDHELHRPDQKENEISDIDFKEELINTLTEDLDASEENIGRSQKIVNEKKLKIPQDNNPKVFQCDTCDATFLNFIEFNAHKKIHGDRRYQCPTCLKWFSKRYRMKNHMVIHEEERVFACSMCENKYTNQGNLDRHVRHYHKQERPYICTECGLSFSRSNVLKQHYAVHTNERNFPCTLCGKRFKTEYYLEVHNRSHLPLALRRSKPNQSKSSKTNFICSYCGKKSNNLVLHKSHTRTHTGEKPFECPTCYKRFPFQQSLRTHLLMHTGEKPHKCDLCNMAFRQIGHLKGHKLVHSGVKQHRCSYCEKAFALKGNLIVHQRLHTGETPYHCDICTKKFYDSNGLKRHKVQHTKNNATKIDENRELKNNEPSDPMNIYLDEEGNELTEIIEMQGDSQIKLSEDGDTIYI